MLVDGRGIGHPVLYHVVAGRTVLGFAGCKFTHADLTAEMFATSEQSGDPCLPKR